jgi:Ca2+-transporting ATPase
LCGVFGGLPAPKVRAMSFTTLVVANLGLILVNRSWTDTVIGGLRNRNAALWYVVAGTLATLAILLWVPFAQRLFGFSVMHASELAISAGAGVLSVLWFEGYKLVRGRPRTEA